LKELTVDRRAGKKDDITASQNLTVPISVYVNFGVRLAKIGVPKVMQFRLATLTSSWHVNSGDVSIAKSNGIEKQSSLSGGN
jgi:hypothetical protein